MPIPDTHLTFHHKQFFFFPPPFPYLFYSNPCFWLIVNNVLKKWASRNVYLKRKKEVEKKGSDLNAGDALETLGLNIVDSKLPEDNIIRKAYFKLAHK